jgi:AcrR family transcriptional regulator
MNEVAVKRSAGRPRVFDRERALAIAMDLFWRHGYEGTSTAQLTAAMGIAAPSLYAAFGSKDQLYFEALALYQSQYGSFFSAALSAALPVKEAISTLLMGAARQYTGAEHAAGCMVATANIHSATDNAAIAEAARSARQTAQAAIQQRLELAIAAGELPAKSDSASLAAYISMVLQGMAVQAHDGAGLAALDRMAELAMLAWPELRAAA